MLCQGRYWSFAVQRFHEDLMCKSLFTVLGIKVLTVPDSMPCFKWSCRLVFMLVASDATLCIVLTVYFCFQIMAGHRNSHGKRHSDYTENGGGKRRNPGDDTYAPGPDDTVYRYLCSSRKIGSIIGRGGEIAKQLRADTQAKIRIGESVPGCDERVITIFSSSRETNTIDDAEGKVCPAQDALFRVHEKLTTDEGPGNEDSEEVLPQVTARLLVPSDQIGCIIGKGGHIIQGIRSDTGAQIRVLSNDHIPACAINGDELLQVGSFLASILPLLEQAS
jgi:poly(rC)-binding protein 3/4